MFDIFSTPWHVISSLLVFIAGLFLSTIICNKIKIKKKIGILIYFWHTIFSIANFSYTKLYISDSYMYYRSSFNSDLEFALGTRAVIYITQFFSLGLNLSFFGVFLVFNIFGTIGLLLFYKSTRIATQDKSSKIQLLGTILVFLPSISFWSGGLSKDSLSFLAVGMALYAALNFKKRIWLIALAIFIMFLVRTHVAAVMISALAIGTLFKAKMKILPRISIGFLFLTITIILIPITIDYVGLDSDANTEDVIEYIDKRQSYYQGTGSGVDIASMSLPMQLFTYIARPLPLEAHNFTSLLASFDNMIMLLLIILGGKNILKRQNNQLPGHRSFLWLYTFLIWIVLAMNTSNLGIAVRQKWMFAPILIFLLISLIDSKPNQQKIKSFFNSNNKLRI